MPVRAILNHFWDSLNHFGPFSTKFKQFWESWKCLNFDWNQAVCIGNDKNITWKFEKSSSHPWRQKKNLKDKCYTYYSILLVEWERFFALLLDLNGASQSDIKKMLVLAFNLWQHELIWSHLNSIEQYWTHFNFTELIWTYLNFTELSWALLALLN